MVRPATRFQDNTPALGVLRRFGFELERTDGDGVHAWLRFGRDLGTGHRISQTDH